MCPLMARIVQRHEIVQGLTPDALVGQVVNVCGRRGAHAACSVDRAQGQFDVDAAWVPLFHDRVEVRIKPTLV